MCEKCLASFEYSDLNGLQAPVQKYAQIESLCNCFELCILKLIIGIFIQGLPGLFLH